MSEALLNDPNAPATARRPRLRIMLVEAGVPGQTNGSGAAYVSPPTNQPIPNAISASVTNNNYYQADTFSCDFALGRVPGDLAFWSEQPRVLVDIQIALNLTDWKSQLIGEIDTVHIDPANGVVSCTGRDLTARLIEAKTQEAFANQSSSEIAATLAARRGLLTVDANGKPSITKTTTPVSRFYQDQHTLETAGQFSETTTEWDLLTKLAKIEGFDCYVFGQTLYFNPRQATSSTPYVLSMDLSRNPPVSNMTGLQMERSLTLARDIEVQVRSWDSRNQRGFTKTAKAIGAKGAQAATAKSNNGLGTQKILIIKGDMTEAQAQDYANNYLREMSKHERVIEASLPGDLILSPRMMVRLQGTGTTFDQAYYADSVTRYIDIEQGFTMNLRAKNRSAESFEYIQQSDGVDAPVAQSSVPSAVQSAINNADIAAAYDARLSLQ